MEDLAQLFEEKMPSNFEDNLHQNEKNDSLSQTSLRSSPAYASPFPEQGNTATLSSSRVTETEKDLDTQGSTSKECSYHCTCLSTSCSSLKAQLGPLVGSTTYTQSPLVLSHQSGRSRRKMGHPHRSAYRFDPCFRGVSVQLRRVLTQDSCQLTITALHNYPRTLVLSQQSDSVSQGLDRYEASASKAVLPFHLRALSPLQQKYFIPSISATAKQCASCGTKKTPLWRDAEDGTPLCNACGIRYKKYRMRCTHCWHIPKKDTKVNSHCTHCGHMLKFSFFKGKMW